MSVHGDVACLVASTFLNISVMRFGFLVAAFHSTHYPLIYNEPKIRRECKIGKTVALFPRVKRHVIL